MLNSKENEEQEVIKTSGQENKEQEVIKRPSGQENETFVVGMGVVQHTRDTYRMEDNGQAEHDVNLQAYITLKLHDNSIEQSDEKAKKQSDAGKGIGD